jgi:hypothetical protein
MAGFKSDKTQKFRTICEVHREIYDLVNKHFPDNVVKNDVESKLEEAFLMAKKMNAKLRQYKHNYDDGWWEKESEEMRQEKHTLRNERNKK